MRPRKLSFLLLASLVMASFAPAFADPETTMADNSAAPASAQAPAASKSSKSKSSSSFFQDLPKKTLGFAAGAAIGIPVAAVRNSIYDEKYTVKQWTGDSDLKRLTYLTGAVWFPFAVSTGVLASPYLALKHSAKSFNEPFSKQQFGLGEMDEYKSDDSK